jgi:hypothetical protein
VDLREVVDDERMNANISENAGFGQIPGGLKNRHVALLGEYCRGDPEHQCLELRLSDQPPRHR